MVRSDSPKRLRNILERRGSGRTRPTWRAVALNILREQIFAAVPGTTAERWIEERGDEFNVQFHVEPMSGYEAGIQAVLDGKASAFFAERAILLDAVKNHKSADDLMVLDRQYTYERLALPIQRGDEDFRLLVDRALSKQFESAGYQGTYAKWFGKPDEKSEDSSGGTRCRSEPRPGGGGDMIQRSIKRLSWRALVVDDELPARPPKAGRRGRSCRSCRAARSRWWKPHRPRTARR